MKRLAFTLMIVLMIAAARAQEISRHDADSLLKSLKLRNTADTSRLKSLLALASFNILKAGEFKIDLDSADGFLKQAAILNAEIRSPEASGYSQLLTAQLTKERVLPSTEMFPKAVEMLKHTKDKFHLGIAELEVQKFYNADIPAELSKKMKILDTAGLLLQQAGTFQQKKYALQELKYNYTFSGINDSPWKINFLKYVGTISRQVNDRENEIWVNREIAAVHILQGKFSLAENELVRILKNSKAKDGDDVTLIYDNLVDLYYDRGDNDKLLSASLEGIKSVKTSQDSAYLPGFYSKIFFLYYNLDNTDQMLQWAIKLRGYFIAHHNMVAVYYYNRQVASCLIKQKKPEQAFKIVSDLNNKRPPISNEERCYMALSLGDCYVALKQYSLAEKSYLEMIRVNENGPPGKYSSTYYYAMGNFYLETKQFRQAGKYLRKGLQAPSQMPLRGRRGVLLNLFKVDSALGNYTSAIKYLQSYHAIKDSIFDVGKNKQFEELQISYQTEQRKKDIKLLQDKEKIQQINLQHAQNTQKWILAGSLMLLLLLVVSYNRYRLKQKSNKIIMQKNELLQHLLAEKEWLLKEVHHRVKNNLHTVICLLESQAAYLENDALKAIENSQHRIFAMSLIHQKLYQSEDIKTIDMSLYLPEFIQYLNEGFGTHRQIRFQLDIEPLKLGVSQAIPIALIINEAVTNSIKYAFPANKNGIIEISMYQEAERIALIIADNGIGIDPVIANSPSDSLGLKLMKGLSEDINASIVFSSNNGTRITIVFNVDPLNDSNNLLTQINEREVYS